MGLWSKVIEEARQGKNLSSHLEYFLEMQSKVKSFSVRKDQSEILDIDGSVEIYPSMLSKGKLAFNIGKVTGDFISFCPQLDQSVFPEQLEGKIIFRNALLGPIRYKFRFKVGETVLCFNKNIFTHVEVKEINISSFYDEKMRIETSVTYKLGYPAIERKEIEIFQTDEEMKERFEKSSLNLSSKNPHSVDVKYPIGYNAWFINKDKPTSQFISRIDIKMTDEAVINQVETYFVKIDNEEIALRETDIFDSKNALLEGIS